MGMMMSNSRSGKDRRRGSRRHMPGGSGLNSEINVTPFVDVMLVLLVIFMVTAPMMTAGIDVNLPESSADPVASNIEPLEVSVTEAGQLYVQDQEVTLETVGSHLASLAASKGGTDTPVYIRGDGGATYRYVVDALAAVSAAGFTKVSLITQVK